MNQYGDITVCKKLLLDNVDWELEYMVDRSGHPPRSAAEKYVTADPAQGQDVSIEYRDCIDRLGTGVYWDE